MTQLKSRRLTYFDFDRQQTRTRLFSALEITHANKIFDTIEDILLENDLSIRKENKWISTGKCGCLKHDDTYFMIEIESDILSLSIIHEIEEAIEELHVELVDILARYERRHTFLQLVMIQQQQQPLSIEKS